MFDLSIWEIAVIGVVAVLVIGPKELPRALMTAGKWLRKFRAITGSFRTGLDAMIRETEMKELEEKWANHNKQIMADHPNEMMPLSPPSSDTAQNDTVNKNKSHNETDGAVNNVRSDGMVEKTSEAIAKKTSESIIEKNSK